MEEEGRTPDAEGELGEEGQHGDGVRELRDRQEYQESFREEERNGFAESRSESASPSQPAKSSDRKRWLARRIRVGKADRRESLRRI